MKDANRVLSLSILDGYAVRWTRETVARDVVQNFFDEVEDFRQVEIVIDDAAKTVRVSGPSSFDLDYLRYVGATTKTVALRKAGGFGEGFKICALVLLRDFGVELRAGAGPWEIRPFLREMNLGRELCYEVCTPETPYAGSFVELRGVDPELRRVFSRAKELFRHPDNPRLSKPIHVDLEHGIGVYLATDPMHGDLFYRGQHRGPLRFAQGAALTFVYDDHLEVLDADRDRRNLKAAAPLLRAIVTRLPDEVLLTLLRHLRVYWEGGNSLLTIIAGEIEARGLKYMFSRRWVAKGKHTFLLERYAMRLGFNLGMPRLGRIGMVGVGDRFGSLEVGRKATSIEAGRMQIAAMVYEALLTKPPRARPVQVFDGPLSISRHDFGGKHCSISAGSLSGSFVDGIADCLYALAVVGGTNASTDGDRLTALLGAIIQYPARLEPFAEAWARAEDPATIAGLPRLLPEYEEEDKWSADTVHAIILAPPGFPPALKIKEQIGRLARQLRVKVHVSCHNVCSPYDAAARYARGIPSVWIGKTEVDPGPGRSRPRYEPRLFSSGTLMPDDGPLEAALLLEQRYVAGRRRTFRMGPSFAKFRAERDRYLRLHEPERWRKHLRRTAVGTAVHVRGLSPESLDTAKNMVAAWVERALETVPGEPDGLEQEAARLVREVRKRLTPVMLELEARYPVLLDGRRRHDLGQLWHEFIGRRVGLDSSSEEVDQILREVTGAWAGLWERSREIPIDETCSEGCFGIASRILRLELRKDTPLEEALARAGAMFDVAVEHAMERHEQVDELGGPLPCHGFFTSFRALRPDIDPLPWKPDIAGAVSRAWEEACGEGLDEVEASRRCLEVAREMSGTDEG